MLNHVGPFVILLYLMPDDLTHQGRASGWERVNQWKNTHCAYPYTCWKSWICLCSQNIHSSRKTKSWKSEKKRLRKWIQYNTSKNNNLQQQQQFYDNNCVYFIFYSIFVYFCFSLLTLFTSVLFCHNLKWTNLALTNVSLAMRERVSAVSTNRNDWWSRNEDITWYENMHKSILNI